ncbi:tyrosine-type recombinase/integrase [Mycobacterium branderi]|uniref:Integrase n=1 Tax=Mycobacterium branderi TaxID=43348 RepID=A0A7I7WAB1_9MYCO|nr:site-specific integrase [Mycobacterium branderi]ORA40709.1 integrase [Mycobacterium branderi]BBZ14576.1 hypothetical protein MBRA_47710 [Mycobacterium branderi]
MEPEAVIAPLPFVADLPGDWDGWLRRAAIVPGTPFLLSPRLEYDIELNAYFQSGAMIGRALKTQEGYARDLAAFLTFAERRRSGRSWKDLDEADHIAYHFWRRRDPSGPNVLGATWNREVAAVNEFFRWALKQGLVHASPIPQASRRPVPVSAGRGYRGVLDELRPATYASDVVRDRTKWLPPEDYRRWRDVGVRGFSSKGLPQTGFRGRWADRNALFCDFMVRTGLRISEQAALTVFDVPSIVESEGYQRFWLPPAIAKGRSARWIYVPSSLVREMAAYMRDDRRAVIEFAQSDGRYRRVRRPYVVENPARPVATVGLGSGAKSIVKVAHLGLAERRRLFVERPSGLEPAAIWLGEFGAPISVDSWKKMFADANDRCVRAGVTLAAHAHMLRHTFAVVTLEQLQRGRIAALGDLNPDQRGHYTRIFGDPLDWVRRRLGHRSVVTTQKYLHALAELEMHTRMALVPETWEHPGRTAEVDHAPASGHAVTR